MLFRLRFQADDLRERQAFVETLNLDWEVVTDEERSMYSEDLRAASGGYPKRIEDESYFKVDWERVPELVENRRAFLNAGKAYVPSKEQLSMVVAEFTGRLDKALEMTSRALPRLDEDDRLTPILTHLSQNFTTPDANYSSSATALPGADISARNIDTLSSSFPLCMQNLHRSLRRDAHLKHYGRLQYTLFLKGIGLNLEECLVFWRSSFNKITDDVFNKEYRYYVRHAYGEVGGDSNRRGTGYSPFSCQKILTEHPPGAGEAHGCPYRHFSIENLTALLQAVGVKDQEVLRGVKEDKEKTKYHLACNRFVPSYPSRLCSGGFFFLFWGGGGLCPFLNPLVSSCAWKTDTHVNENETGSSTTSTNKRSRKFEMTGRGAPHNSRRSFILMSTSNGVTC